MADVVPVEHVGMHAAMEQVALDRLRESRFPGARKAREPNDRTVMTTPPGTLTCRNFSLCPENIFALCNLPVGINPSENCAAAADFSLFHNDESPEVRDAIMVIHDQGSARLNG